MGDLLERLASPRVFRTLAVVTAALLAGRTSAGRHERERATGIEPAF